MANTKSHFTQDDLAELAAKAGGMFNTLVQLTETPREAAEIILMMHMLLFLNYGDGTATCETMLADYAKNFTANWELQQEHAKKDLN